MSDSNDERPGEGAAPDRRSVLQTAVSGDGAQSSRRGVVAGAVASVAAALGLTGTAAAAVGSGRTAQLRSVERRYRDEALAVDALQERGADVLAQLAEEGYLDRGDVAELDAPEVSAIESEGTFTAHLAAETRVDEGMLTVVVEPEADRQYAILDRDGEGYTVFDPELGEVKPMCPAGYGCAGGGCTCDEYELVYCNGNCYVRGRTGFTCTGCGACGSPACGY